MDEILSETRMMLILAFVGLIILVVVLIRSTRIRTILERTIRTPSSSETIETNPDEVIVRNNEGHEVAKRARHRREKGD